VSEDRAGDFGTVYSLEVISGTLTLLLCLSAVSLFICHGFSFLTSRHFSMRLIIDNILLFIVQAICTTWKNWETKLLALSPKSFTCHLKDQAASAAVTSVESEKQDVRIKISLKKKRETSFIIKSTGKVYEFHH